MWKKILVIVVLLGFAWSLPGPRAKMIHAMAPALDLLGPVGYKLQEPMRRFRADTDVKFLVEQLQVERTEGRQAPGNVKAFNEWMAKRPGAGDKGKDPWGNQYWMKKSGNAVTVGSNGPDGTRDTGDDIRRSAVL